MSIDITPRWGGPSDASSSSTYKVERSLNLTDWTELAASQAATSPYVSPVTTLDGDVDYGATTINLTSGTNFSTTGYGWLDGEAMVQWTGKSTDQLTGVTWHSGYGTYADGSAFIEAHESYADTNIDPTANAVVYKITHTDSNGNVSAPAFIWYYYPPIPASSGHCVLIVVAGSDLGITRQSSVDITVELYSDDQFDTRFGAQLDQAGGSNLIQSNALGISCFQCWKNSVRANSSGIDMPYTVTIDDAEFSVSTIPDRDWILLSQVVDSA